MSENTKMDDTMKFTRPTEEVTSASAVLTAVYSALKEKGYNPINQIVGYLITGDPAYITSYKNARTLMRQLQRDELLEELVTFYLNENETLEEDE